MIERVIVFVTPFLTRQGSALLCTLHDTSLFICSAEAGKFVDAHWFYEMRSLPHCVIQRWFTVQTILKSKFWEVFYIYYSFEFFQTVINNFLLLKQSLLISFKLFLQYFHYIQWILIKRLIPQLSPIVTYFVLYPQEIFLSNFKYFQNIIKVSLVDYYFSVYPPLNFVIRPHI